MQWVLWVLSMEFILLHSKTDHSYSHSSSLGKCGTVLRGIVLRHREKFKLLQHAIKRIIYEASHYVAVSIL